MQVSKASPSSAHNLGNTTPDPEVFTLNPPNPLLRFFKKVDHARSFIGGEIRFGLLDIYKTIEDGRRDAMEGVAKFSWSGLPNPAHYEGSSLNIRFILCTSHPEAERSVLTERFGSYIVRINEPIALLDRINVAWCEHPWASGPCGIAPVVYNKGELLERNPCLVPP
jgi:hypothetical protein